MAMKKKTEEAPKEVEPNEVAADNDDQLAIYSDADDSIVARLAYAKKAVVAAVAAAATLAISLGVGDEETWGQISAVIVALIGVLGVFYASNDPGE